MDDKAKDAVARDDVQHQAALVLETRARGRMVGAEQELLGQLEVKYGNMTPAVAKVIVDDLAKQKVAEGPAKEQPAYQFGFLVSAARAFSNDANRAYQSATRALCELEYLVDQNEDLARAVLQGKDCDLDSHMAALRKAKADLVGVERTARHFICKLANASQRPQPMN